MVRRYIFVSYQSIYLSIALCHLLIDYIAIDILDLTKLDENMIQLERAPFSLQNNLEESLDIISFDAEKKRLDMVCDVDMDTLPELVVGDSNR